MRYSFKHHLRSYLTWAGLDVRRTLNLVGVDPLQDIKKLHKEKTFTTILDVGANVGQSALRFQAAFPTASIQSFEPVSASYQTGKANTSSHPQIRWHHAAVGNSCERIIFYSSGTSQMNSISSTANGLDAPPGERNEVDVIRLDDFSAKEELVNIDLLKTDTEGFDLAVLEGARNILSARRIKYILCEVGFTKEDIHHSYFPPIANYLEQFEYRLVNFYGISDIHHFRKWGVTYADALFCVPEPFA